MEITPDGFARFVESAVTDIARHYASDTWQRVVFRTPVDTGSLRHGWNGTTFSVDFSFQMLPDGSAPRMPPRPKFDRAKYPVYNIANGAHYGYEVEVLGKSHTKAPAGMAQIGLMESANIPWSFRAVLTPRTMAVAR